MDAASTTSLDLPRFRFPGRVNATSLVVGLTTLALLMRLGHIGSRPLWLDEAFSQWFSSQSFHYLWTAVPTYEVHPPFYYSLLKTWRWIAGDSSFALRSLSLLFAIATIPIVIAIGLEQERQDETGRPLLRAGVAAFLAACSPMLITTGQEVRPYPLVAFAFSIAILGLFRLRRQFAGGGSGEWSSWLLLASGTELSLWAHGLGLLYALALALALAPSWLQAPVSRQRLIRGACTAGAIALAYLPCLMMIAARAGDWGANWLAWEPALFFPQLLALYTVPVEALSIGTAVTAMAMAVLIKRAMETGWKAQGWSAQRVTLILWLAPPLIAAIISALFIPIFLARTLSATLIPGYLAMGAAIARTPSAKERQWLTAAICITLLPTALVYSLRPAAERWDLAASYLSRNVGPADQIWLYPADSALPIAATGIKLPGVTRAVPEAFPTLSFKGPIRAGWPAVVSLTPQQAAGFANDPKIGAVPRIWLVTRQSGIFDPAGDMPAALSKSRQPGAVERWGYIAVQPFALPPGRGR